MKEKKIENTFLLASEKQLPLRKNNYTTAVLVYCKLTYFNHLQALKSMYSKPKELPYSKNNHYTNP
jgi:hypothetical protein